MKQHNRLQWYRKYTLFGDISIRYYHKFQDRNGYENKWFIKDHKTKTYNQISKQMVERIISDYKKIGNIKEEEIVGWYNGKEYRKIDLLNLMEDRVKDIIDNLTNNS